MEIHWQEAHERMKRLLARALEPMSGNDREAHVQHVVDDLAAFFVFCFHLKDWLRNDSTQPLPKHEVEVFVNASESLGLCADLANATKHAVLRGGPIRRDSSPQIHGGNISRDFALLPNAIAHESVQLRFVGSWFEVATSTGKEYDALDLARRCVREWDDFLSGKGLL